MSLAKYDPMSKDEEVDKPFYQYQAYQYEPIHTYYTTMGEIVHVTTTTTVGGNSYGGM